MKTNKLLAATLMMAAAFCLSPISTAAESSISSDIHQNETFEYVSSKYTPNKPKFTKEATGYNTIRIKWSKIKKATGYKIGICVNGVWKNFDSTSTTHTFKRLDRHTKYRFRVRSYRKVNGKTYFSKYSYATVATNRTIKSKTAFKIYESPSRKSDVLYRGNQYTIITQKGYSKNGWTKVFVPNTKTIGYVDIQQFAGYSDLKINPINQYGNVGGGCMYYGCEATSLATVLDRQYKVKTSKNTIADDYVVNISPGSGDPNYAFWGSPYASSGYGVYAPAIAQAAHWYLKDKGIRNKYNIELHTNFLTANNPTGCPLNLDNLSLGNTVITKGYSLSQIKKELNKGHSLIVWWTLDAGTPYNTGTYTLEKGGKYTAAGEGEYDFTWIGHQHCAVISGYDDVRKEIRIADVHHGQIRTFSYARFFKGYKAYSRQTVVIYPKPF